MNTKRNKLEPFTKYGVVIHESKSLDKAISVWKKS